MPLTYHQQLFQPGQQLPLGNHQPSSHHGQQVPNQQIEEIDEQQSFNVIDTYYGCNGDEIPVYESNNGRGEIRKNDLDKCKHSSNDWVCPFCYICVARKQNLECHINTVHKHDIVLRCKTCGEPCKNGFKLKSHEHDFDH